MDAITKIERDVGELHESLANHITDGVARDAEITYKIEGISSKIEELNTSIKGLVTVWEQVPGIRLIAFAGERPRSEAYLLADTEAQRAENVKLTSGALVPVKAPYL